jgi:hypothetical protein
MKELFTTPHYPRAEESESILRAVQESARKLLSLPKDSCIGIDCSRCPVNKDRWVDAEIRIACNDIHAAARYFLNYYPDGKGNNPSQ